MPKLKPKFLSEAFEIYRTIGPSFEAKASELPDGDVLLATLQGFGGWVKLASGAVSRATVMSVAEIVWQRVVGPCVRRALENHKLRLMDRMFDRFALVAAHWAFMGIVLMVFTLYQRASNG